MPYKRIELTLFFHYYIAVHVYVMVPHVLCIMRSGFIYNSMKTIAKHKSDVDVHAQSPETYIPISLWDLEGCLLELFPTRCIGL